MTLSQIARVLYQDVYLIFWHLGTSFTKENVSGTNYFELNFDLKSLFSIANRLVHHGATHLILG